MAEHLRLSLGVHTVRVRRKREREYLQFGEADSGRPLANLFVSWADRLKMKHEHHDGAFLSWSVRHLERRPTGVLCGLVDVGEYGAAGRLLNVRSGEERKITVDEAKLIPLFFLLDLPDDTDTGILILQRHGIRSPYSFFQIAFVEALKIRAPDLLLELKPYVTEEVLRVLKEGHLRKVIYTSRTTSKDLATTRGIALPKEVGIRVETVYTLPDEVRGIPERFLDWIRRTDQSAERVELPEGVDGIRFEVYHQGATRTLRAGAAENMVPYIDVTSRMERSEGHPVYDDIMRFALNWHANVATEIRGGR